MSPSRRPRRDRDDFIERFGSALADAGMARLPSRAFGALLIDDDGRMTAAELAERLQVSPAAISGAVRYLGSIGLLRRERERGSRRDVFVVMEDAWHGAIVRKDQTYAPIQAALVDGIDAVGGAQTHVGSRLQLSNEFLTFVSKEMDGMLERWEAHLAERTA